MWTRQLFGTDVYHLVSAFIIYSILGWMVESVYMSICNRKLTNRGFGRGPFCPIYGFGAVLCYLILHPLNGEYLKLYLVGALLATIFEFSVGKLMLRLFGEVWWDYHEKPCNYKGIICLESTLAWGMYAIIIIRFLHVRVLGFIDTYNYSFGVMACKLILIAVTIDYILKLMKIFHTSLKERRDWIIDRYHSFKARWY